MSVFSGLRPTTFVPTALAYIWAHLEYRRAMNQCRLIPSLRQLGPLSVVWYALLLPGDISSNACVRRTSLSMWVSTQTGLEQLIGTIPSVALSRSGGTRSYRARTMLPRTNIPNNQGFEAGRRSNPCPMRLLPSNSRISSHVITLSRGVHPKTTGATETFRLALRD